MGKVFVKSEEEIDEDLQSLESLLADIIHEE